MSGSGLASACSRSGVGQDESADLEVVELGISAVGVGDEMAAERHVDRRVGRALVRRRCRIGQARRRATGPSGTRRGMRVSMTLTTPPIADEPNSSADGPRSTSIRSAVSGLIGDRVVGVGRGQVEAADAVDEDCGRARPEGREGSAREAVGPKLDAVTPGWLASVSPMLGRSVAGQLFLVDDRDAAEHVACRRDAGDDDRLVVVGMRLGGVAGNRLGCSAARPRRTPRQGSPAGPGRPSQR